MLNTLRLDANVMNLTKSIHIFHVKYTMHVYWIGQQTNDKQKKKNETWQ